MNKVKLTYSMTTTTWIIIITVLVWLIWDIVAFTSEGEFSTISEVLTEWAYYSPPSVLAIGILVGHWYWPVYIEKKK